MVRPQFLAYPSSMIHTHLSIPAEVLIKDGMDFPLDGEGVKWDSIPVTEIVNPGGGDIGTS